MISAKASKGFLRPKNNIDQRAFRASWMIKNFKAACTASLSCSILFQTRPAAIPIIINKVDQTGAKTQLGGLKLGLIRVGYQVSMLDFVSRPVK